MKSHDAVYLVIGWWPEMGEQFWRGGVFDSAEEAKAAFADYQKDYHALDAVKLLGVARINLPENRVRATVNRIMREDREVLKKLSDS